MRLTVWCLKIGGKFHIFSPCALQGSPRAKLHRVKTIKYEWRPTSGIKTLRYEGTLSSTKQRHSFIHYLDNGLVHNVFTIYICGEGFKPFKPFVANQLHTGSPLQFVVAFRVASIVALLSGYTQREQPTYCYSHPRRGHRSHNTDTERQHYSHSAFRTRTIDSLYIWLPVHLLYKSSDHLTDKHLCCL